MLYRFGEFRLDTLRRELSRSDQPIAIPRRAFELLLLLIRNRDRALSKEELFDALWPDRIVSEASLFECVAVARRALGRSGAKLIRTVHGRGYTFDGTVEEATARSTGPLPASPGVLFVGRAESLRAFEEALEGAQCSSGRRERGGRILLLSGGPGLGKSRLLREFSTTARNVGCLTLLGRCSEVGGAPAYWPWVQVLRNLRREVPKAIPSALWDEVMILDPARSPEGRTLSRDNDSARFHLFDTVVEVLRRIAELQTTVILLDDMHRADLPSLHLLAYLAEELTPLRIVIAATHREFELTEDPERSAVLAQVSRQPCAYGLPLKGLTREEVGRLASSLVDAELPAHIALRLHHHTAGNPFLLIQLLKQGLPDDLDRVSWDLRPTVRTAVLRHLAALPENTRRMLGIAAVLGRQFDAAALAQTSYTTEGDVLAQVAPAVTAGVITAPREGGGIYVFRHILLRDALYDEWSKDEQARWHLRAARALQKRHAADPRAHVAELADHFLRAVPIGPVSEAVRYSIAAGKWAAEQLAFEESASCLRQAAELDDLHSVLAPAQRCDLLADLGGAYNGCGKRSTARRALEEAAGIAEGLADGRRLAKVALAASPGFFAIETGVEDRPLVDLLELALSRCPPAERALRSQLLCRLSMAIYWSRDSARRYDLSSEASELAEMVGDPWVTAQARVIRFAACWSADDLHTRVAEANRIVEMSESAGDRELSLMARVFHTSTLLEQGDVAAFRREVKSLRHLIETGRHPHASWYPLLYDATLALISGRLNDVAHFVNEYAAVGQRFGDVNAASSMAVHRILLSWLQGNVAQAVDLSRLAANRPHAVPAHRCAWAFLASLAGRRSEAHAEVKQLCAGDFAALPKDMLWLFSMAVLGEAIAVLGDRECAKTCYDALRHYQGRQAIIGYGIVLWGPIDRTLGLLAAVLGAHDRAEEHFRHALEMSELLGARVISVATRLGWAQLLAARGSTGDLKQKAALCREALAEAREMGLSYYRKELEALLRNA